MKISQRRRYLNTHSFEIRYKFQNLVELLEERALEQPSKRAFTFLQDGENEESTFTYETLLTRAQSIAAYLQDSQLTGERALLLYRPGLEFIAAFFGCLLAGVVAVPGYPPSRNREEPRLKAIASNSQAKVILTSGEVLETVTRRIENVPVLGSLRTIDTIQVPNDLARSWRDPAITRDTIAFLQYTSGSSGSPKGVMVSHGNLLYNLELIRHAMALEPEDLGVLWLPLHHDMGLIGGVLDMVYSGGQAVLMSPTAFVEKPSRWLQAITDYRATFSGGPNFAYDYCTSKVTAEQKESIDLSTWETAFCGAETVRAETFKRFAETFAPLGYRLDSFQPVYGLAEATLIVSGGATKGAPNVQTVSRMALESNTVIDSKAGDDSVTQLVGCGKALGELEIEIVDPQSLTRCETDKIGEIWVSGASVAMGYWGQETETKNVFHAYLADRSHGPFLRTGDLGYLNKGELYITGRLKDLIIIRGNNYFPDDIEQTVSQTHPALRHEMGAAFTIEKDGNEQLVLVHELNRHYSRHPDLESIIAAIRQAISERHELRAYAICLIQPHKLPRTSSGKIQRFACREAFLRGDLAILREWKSEVVLPAVNKENHAAPPDINLKTSNKRLVASIQDWLVREIARRSKIDRSEINPSQPVDRYGLDSLDAVELRMVLETKTNCSLTESFLWELPSIAAVAHYVANESSSNELRSMEPAFVAEVISRFESDSSTLVDTKVIQPSSLIKVSLPTTAEPTQPEIRGDAASFGSQRLALLNERTDKAKAKGNYFYEPVIDSLEGSWVVVKGRRMLMLASYSYLGLIGHPKINLATQAAIAEYGTGSHGTRILAGTSRLHRELETTIARFKNRQDAVVFPGGYLTNLTTISTIVGKGHVVICDKLDHTSIADGCALSQARLMVFRHNDMEDLERCLQEAGNAGKLVVVDSVFSMEGDVVDLPKVATLCKQYGAYLMVDEAHSLGVLGATGHGIEEHFGLDGDVIDIKMGTLSKSIPSFGGYVAGNAELISALKHNAHGFIFSAALPPPQVAAAKAAFEVIQEEPERVGRLKRNVQHYIEGLRTKGFTMLKSETPIVPIVCRTEDQTMELTRSCQASGLFALPVTYPAVPINSPRLRTTVTAAHTEQEIDFAIEVLTREAKRCGVI